MPQNEYIELHHKCYGYCLDYHEKKVKKEELMPREKQKCSKLFEQERERRKRGRGWLLSSLRWKWLNSKAT
ncbi:hypothetical protein GH733_015021 [Mirounga leonina]|nr:hypothetical protein GH733_015021 [Mirounga leonina]